MTRRINFVLAMSFLLFGIILFLPSVMAAASFSVTGFSCTPSEAVINDVFSCTTQVKNTGDASGSVSVATLYPDDNDWLESSNYAQASGTSVGAGQSVEITFTGLRAVISGNNGFSKIMLDDVTDTYVSDNNVKVNIINVVVSVSNSISSITMGGVFDVSAEVSSGGDIDVSLTFSVNSGGCSIGTQDASKSINNMQDGSKQSRTWSVTQGTTGACSYTISAAATGIGGIASKIDSTTGSVSCTNCPSGSSSSTSSGGGGSASGGGGVATLSLGELKSEQTVSLGSGESVSFKIENVSYSLVVSSMTMTGIVIKAGGQSFDIELEKTENIDLNGDGMSEISVKLKSINSITNKASIVLTPNAVPVVKKGITGGVVLSPDEKKIKIAKGIFYWVLGIVAIIVAVWLVMRYSSRKKMGF